MTTTLQRYAAGEDQCGAGHSKAYYQRQVQDARRYAHIVDEDRRHLSEMLAQKQEEIDTLHAMLEETRNGMSASPAQPVSIADLPAAMIIPELPTARGANGSLVEASRCSS
jgi:hypothetical protein